MPFKTWGRTAGGDRASAADGNRAFYEREVKRSALPLWEKRWLALSAKARSAVLDKMRYPIRDAGPGGIQSDVSAEKFDPKVLDELRAAGFVTTHRSPRADNADRVRPVAEASDFVKWARGLQRYRLLQPDDAWDAANYINWALDSQEWNRRLLEILKSADIKTSYMYDHRKLAYITTADWPGWVAGWLKQPLAEPILTAVLRAGSKIARSRIAALLPKAKPDEVLAVVDQLVGHLALFEDLDPVSLDVLVGYAPRVAKKLEESEQRRSRPPLEVCERPAEVGMTSGVFIDDLRAFLLEIASDPPPIRQDGMLFARQLDRFLKAFEFLPDWLAQAIGVSAEGRLDRTLSRATLLGFAERSVDGTTSRLTITRGGSHWLASRPADQYADLYEAYRRKVAANTYSFHDGYLQPRPEVSRFVEGGYVQNDSLFLGSCVCATRARKTKSEYNSKYMEFGHEDALAWREALADRFMALEPEKFYLLESILAHHSFGKDNVVYLGLSPAEVAVGLGGEAAPRLEEVLVGLGRLALDGMVRCRLLPLGALRAAVDEKGRLCIARTHRLGAYFGREPMGEEGPSGAAEQTRVVVQPDFSVMVIGLNPAPVAELVPFCDRVTRASASGAQTLKITRDSVVKAVGHGLTPEEIVERLRRLASIVPPANVLREVREWGGHVRRIEAATLSVVRCPDRDTADRLMAALKGRVERINDTIVAIDEVPLPKAQRDRLQAQGLLLEGGWAKPAVPGTPKAKKRRRRLW